MSSPKIDYIFHPSDFSEASEIAFAHALKIALVTRAMFDMLHVAARSDADWKDFPGVRSTLERWRLIPEGSDKGAVQALGIEVTKVIAKRSTPVKACLEYLNRHPVDLIVLAVHQYDGRMRWLDKRVGEPIARGAGEMTLFIPEGVQGFVSWDDGSISLRSVLIPIAAKPRAQPAADALARMIRNVELPSGTVTLLHVGKAADAPYVSVPDDLGWVWNRQVQEGEPVETILQTAAGTKADLIVMTTQGPQGFLDALRGSTTQRVLQECRCPLLSLPG